MGAGGLGSRAIIGRFFQKLEEFSKASWIEKVGMPFPSNQESEEYKWLGMAPMLREWVGGRNAKGFRENGIIIKNKTFEATLEVLVDDIRRDKTGQVYTRIDELAVRAVQHWAKLLSTLIINGESGVCYDGQFFFDTDHSEGDSGTQDNDIQIDISVLPTSVHGTTTIPAAEELELAILEAVQQILGFKDDQGEPLNAEANSFLVQVPVPFMAPALAACKNPVLSSGKVNTLVQADGFNINLSINPRLTWTDQFAVYRTDGAVKPFILQEEEGVKVDAIAEGSEEEFKHNRHLYGVKAVRNVGYGFWQDACLVKLI